MRPDPATHRCTLGSCDYTDVKLGRIVCAPHKGGCGRVWTAIRGKGWQPDPRPVGAGRRPFR